MLLLTLGSYLALRKEANKKNIFNKQ